MSAVRVGTGVMGAYAPPGERIDEGLRSRLAGSPADRAEAFSALLDASLDRCFRLAAVMLGNGADAEDAVADATLRAWQHVGSLKDVTRFDAWFGRTLVNVCRDRLRARRSQPEVLAFDPEGRGDAFSESVERAALMEALGALTPEHRAVVALHYLEGLTVDEIAARIGARPGTVKSRLHYGVSELRAAHDAALREPASTDP